MKLYGQKPRHGTNVRSLFSAPRAGGPRFAYHALCGATPGGRSRKAADGRERGVPVYLPPIPDLPGVDIGIEVAGVPAGAILSAGRTVRPGTWALSRDEAGGLRLLPAMGSGLPGPVSLRVTVRATDRATGRTASVSASIDVGAPWDGGPSAPAGGMRYGLEDDAGGRFEIDPVSGLVSVADESLLDRAAERHHTIAVRIAAADGSISIRRFRITLLDGAAEFSISDVVEGEEPAPKRAAVWEMPAEFAA